MTEAILYPAIRQSNQDNAEKGEIYDSQYNKQEFTIDENDDTIGVLVGGTDVLTLPKWGEPYEYCGKWGYVEACEDHCKPIPHKVHCDRPECPICYQKWAGRIAGRARDRLIGVEGAHDKAGMNLGTCKALVVSPPQSWARDLVEREGYAGLNKIYKRLYQVLKMAGVEGGVVVDHPFRAHNIGEAIEGNWNIELHFHILGYGWIMKSDRFERESNGWIYKNLGARPSMSDKFGSIFYYLTHRGLFYRDGARLNQCVRYFGCCHWHRVGREVIDTSKEVKACDKCNGPVHKWYDCDVTEGIDGFTVDMSRAIQDDEVIIYHKDINYFIRARYLPSQSDIMKDFKGSG